jgi:RNA 3'-terminal phosphate cyclase
MSRAYRIQVSESIRRVIRASDRVSTQLEILQILPPRDMGALLRQELEAHGFAPEGDQMVRSEGDAKILVEPATGTVTMKVEADESVEVEGTEAGFTYSQKVAEAKKAKEEARLRLRKNLDAQVEAERAKLQKALTDKLEGQLGDVRKELDQIANKVTAEALKVKARQMGQVKEITEDPESGSLTIVVEV